MSRYFEIKEGSLEDSIVKNIQEKSVSVAQQKAAGLALAAKRGEKDPDELQGPSKEMMKMSEKDLEDFAKTKHKGLPMKKEENAIDEKVRHQDLVDKYEKLTGKKAPSGTSTQSLKLMITKAEREKKEETEVTEKYDVKTAKSKMGKITVKSFDSLDDAKAHLEKMKQKGEKGIISQNGKPVTESKEEYKKVFDAALKKFNVSSPGDFKTDELKKKFFNYVDANYKAKNEETEVTEKKNLAEAGYQIYHKLYSYAVQHAVKQAEKKGYTVDPDAYDREVALGPRKPGEGKTNRFSLPLMKNGKPQKKTLNMQIYGMGNQGYELNMYIEETEHLEESDMKSAMKKLLGRDAKTSTSGASGFQKTMYHVNDDMYVTFNDKSNLGDVYYKGKNVDSFRGAGSPDMEKVVKKYMKKYGVKSEESGSKTMTGKPWSQIKVEK